MVPDELSVIALDTILPRRFRSLPVKEVEANSPVVAVPMVERVIVPEPALSTRELKFPVAASRGERIMVPPAELMARLVPASSSIEAAEKLIAVLELVKVVVEPLVKNTEGAVYVWLL